MVAPVFFLFLVGAVEFGRAIMVQEALTNASREGARVATLDGSLDSDVSMAATDYLTAMNVSGAKVTPSPDNPGLSPAGTEVTVTVSIPYMSVTWVPSPWFLRGATLTASTTMQRETTQ
jgi:Flp pilus assembly protein TadG